MEDKCPCCPGARHCTPATVLLEQEDVAEEWAQESRETSSPRHETWLDRTEDREQETQVPNFEERVRGTKKAADGEVPGTRKTEGSVEIQLLTEPLSA